MPWQIKPREEVLDVRRPREAGEEPHEDKNAACTNVANSIVDERDTCADCQGLIGGKDHGWLGVAVEGGSCLVWSIGLSELGFGLEQGDEWPVHVCEEFWLVECEDHDNWLCARGSEDAIVVRCPCFFSN